MSTKACFVTAVGALALSLSTGCDDAEWPEPQYIDSLRILGVHAEPPTLSSGALTRLSISCVDGSRGTGAEPTCNVDVAWFAQCNNPDQNDPGNCLGRYADWADTLALQVADTPTGAYPDGFGFGPTFNFAAPESILNATFEAAGSVIRYGTSYVFFAACAGQLVSIRNASERLPVECRDRRTGTTLDQRSFVVGVTTLYSYDRVTSRNPLMLSPRFDGVEIPGGCDVTAECPSGFDCSIEGQCLPVVRPCADEESCEVHCLTFELGVDSFSLFAIDGTRLEAPEKSLWLSYLTNTGNLPDDEASFGLDAPTDAASVKRTQCIRWQAPSTPTEHAHLWAVVRDSRGGFAVWDLRIIVR